MKKRRNRKDQWKKIYANVIERWIGISGSLGSIPADDYGYRAKKCREAGCEEPFEYCIEGRKWCAVHFKEFMKDLEENNPDEHKRITKLIKQEKFGPQKATKIVDFCGGAKDPRDYKIEVDRLIQKAVQSGRVKESLAKYLADRFVRLKLYPVGGKNAKKKSND